MATGYDDDDGDDDDDDADDDDDDDDGDGDDDDDDDGDDGYDDDDDDYVRLTGKLFHSLSHLMYPLPSGLNLQVIKKTFPYACTFYNIYCSSLSTRLQTNCLLMQNKTQTPLK